ncbi:hypothetical protein EYV94_27375 [Puteibacter caeruleilacunae]|nr:hypothetical protein EYV94_27375 [Puteibacter caeruleilacunae]
MVKWIIILVAFLCSCSEYKGSKDSDAYDCVEVVFDGYGEYDIEGELSISFIDSTVVKKLNELKNVSKGKWVIDNKATEYFIRLYYEDTETGEKLVISISKSKGSTPTIEYGLGTLFDAQYKNEKLVDYVGSLIKLEEIKQYKGSLTQEVYDKRILKVTTLGN